MNELEWTTRKQRIETPVRSALLRREVCHFATESGESKGQFYTPTKVSRVMAEDVGLGSAKSGNQTIHSVEKTDEHLHCTPL